MEKITRFFLWTSVQKAYVRSSILRACMENQYQTFPPEDHFPEVMFHKLDTAGEGFWWVGVEILARKSWYSVILAQVITDSTFLLVGEPERNS